MVTNGSTATDFIRGGRGSRSATPPELRQPIVGEEAGHERQNPEGSQAGEPRVPALAAVSFLSHRPTAGAAPRLRSVRAHGDHGRIEQVAASRDRLNVTVLVIVERGAHLLYALDQRVVGDDHGRPQRFDQSFLRRYSTAVQDEVLQRVEGLGPQVEPLAVAE